MAATVAVTLSTSAYTALGTTETAVGCFVRPGQRIRLSMATTAPASDTTGFIAVECEAGRVFEYVDFSRFGVGSGDEVYALSEFGSLSLIVNRGSQSAGATNVTVVAPLGRSADAASIPAALSTEDVALLANLGAVSTGSLTSLASGAGSQQLLAANASRKGLLLVNTDANAVRVKYGTTASASSFTILIAGNNGYWEMPQPIYTGRLDAIWDADGSGSLFATEL